MRVAIVGAGPGGLFASIVLADAGHDVILFEQSDIQDDAGAGIQLSPNGTRLLARYGLLEALCDTAFRPQAAVLLQADTGQVVFRTLLGETAQKRYGAPYLHLHRADLTRVLHAAALEGGVTIQSHVRVTGFEDDARVVRVDLENGTTYNCDLLIGADGIHSAVRTTLFGMEQARFTGHIAWRGIVPASRIDEELIPPDATVWAGAGRHFVHYFVQSGNLINFVAVKETASWTEENWRLPGNRKELHSAFSGWNTGITQLIECSESCNLWGLFDRQPLPHWTKGRVALVGDACHPMLPFMAQGAVMAFEDAIVLARVVSANADTPSALRRYEDIRRPRTTRVQERARRNGNLFHLEPGFKRAATMTPLMMLNRLAPDVIARQLDWIYGYDAFAVDL